MRQRDPRFHVTSLFWLFCLSVLVALPAAAQAGAITGKVTDATGEFGFGDATVEIVELERETTTDRSGRFRFSNVPDGAYTLRAEYVGAEPGSATIRVDGTTEASVDIAMGGENQLDGLLVEGQAAGQAAAINRRRRDETVTNVVSADSVGQFPDKNVAESLQRVPGVSTQTDQGEGRFAVIRGIDPRFNTTSVDGVRIPGPEPDNRAVNLDVISSDLVESIEVNKAVTPDMDGDAVGGHIEINTLTAFDTDGQVLRFTAGGSYNSVNEETSPDLTFTYADLFSLGGDADDFGVAFSINKFDRDFVSDGIESAAWPDRDTPGGATVRSMEEGEQRDYGITRDRTSVSLNFDFRPSDTSEYYVRTLYSEFDESEQQFTNLYNFADATTQTLDGSTGTFSDGEVEKESADSNKIVEIFSLTLGARKDLAPWFLDYSVGYSQAGEESGDSEVIGLFVAEGLDIGYDSSGDPEQPRLFSTSPAINDPTAFGLSELEEETVFNETREIALTFNARRDVMFGADVPGYLKFGAKSRLQTAENDIELLLYEDFGGDFSIADFQGTSPDFPKPGNFGPVIDPGIFRSFYNTNRGNFTLNAEDSAIDSQAEDYDLDEDIHAVYAMADAQFDRLQVIGGLRVEYTDYSASGTRVSIDEQSGTGNPVLEPVSDDNSYTDFFPGLHLRYQLSERMVLRGALTRTISRPGFEQISPRQNLEITDEGGGVFERNAEIGNPDLDPLESNNLDLRWEYYPGGIGVISAGVFYKQISDFFIVADTAGQAPFGNFDEVIQTINGDDADLFGLELEFVRQFSFLPAPWDGFLMQATYTLTDSESDIPQRSSTIPLPGQSDHIGNVALGYEKYGLSLRVAAAYRSEFFEEADDLSDPRGDRYQDDFVQVDLTTRYRLNDAYQVYFNAININDAPLYAYYGSSRFNSQHEEYGESYEFGLQVDF